MELPFNPGPNRSMIHQDAAPVAAGPIRIPGPSLNDPGYYKAIVLDVLGVLAALALGCAYHAYFTAGLSLWFSLAAFMLFGIVSSLQVFLQKKTKRRAFAILGETLAFIVWFMFVDWRIAASVAAVMFIFLLWGYSRSRSELAYTTEIRFFRMTRIVIGNAATATLIAMIFFYLVLALPSFGSQSSAGQANGGNFFVSESNFQLFYNWAAGVFNNFYPGVLVNGSFNDFAQSVVQHDLESNPSYSALPPAQQSLAVTNAIGQFADSFSSRLGVTIASSTPTSDVFYGGLFHAFQNAQDRLQGWFFALWAAVVFIFFRIIGMIVVWITQLLSVIVYEILLSMGFMKVVQRPDVKEEVEY